MIVLHAGGDRGFVPGADLLFKAKSASGDYHDEMNHVNFVKHIHYIKYAKMHLLYRIYGPHTTQFVVYASLVTAFHESIDLKHRSPWIRLYPLLSKSLKLKKEVSLFNMRKQLHKKHSLHGEITASALLKLFINS